MEKPPAEPLEAAGGLALIPRGSEHEIPPLPVAPVTPVTPVTAEAFTLLHDLILERDAHALDYTEKQNLQRHLQKLTKAAQSSVVRSALQEEQIRFLREINDEGKGRRDEKSLVLGKARVMSYEDLEAARAKRVEKEADKAARKKRGRKRKGRVQEASLLGTAEGVAQAETQEPAGILSTVYATRLENGVLAPCPGRAPVARMW